MASLKRWLDLRRNPWKAEHYAALKSWRADNALKTRFHTYDGLAPEAVVLDVGGFEGGWADLILSFQPKARVHVFEPHPRFAEALRSKFACQPNVMVHEFAIGGAEGVLRLSDDGDASSAFGGKGGVLEAPIRPADAVFTELGLDRVDLMKVNIEGGEYDLLPALLDSGLMPRIGRLQVQFHLFEPALIETRAAICARLAETHDCAWSYPFIWEEWRLR
ncbi:FkbM family methyltransferase [Ruegeria marina]|uniref:Methyltransferase, FkbM family n=1 Tax=Ruegeria marina TaxID=639004 RepID=A0A1G6NI51_9RHOB|nr:FkbM family methyltransferase [Ruegeria marina]SDC67074.1 methyltransferase, FkbM family [Ruegeria marina]